MSSTIKPTELGGLQTTAAVSRAPTASVADTASTKETGGHGQASRVHEKLRQLHDELTECPICLGEFSIPKQLPCLHTFCVACLRRMTARNAAGDRVPCPMCAQPFAVPHGGVDALPKNFVIDRLVELLRTVSDQYEPDNEYEPHPDTKYTTPVSTRPPDNFKPPAAHAALPSAAAPDARPIHDHQSLPTNPAETATTAVSGRRQSVKMFKDATIFRSVDVHAYDVSNSQHETVRELIWNLIYARDINNELEKARALFRWMCTINSATFRFDLKLATQRGTPEEVLTRFQTHRATCAEVFQKLCELAGLRCQIISGRVKSASYRPEAAPSVHRGPPSSSSSSAASPSSQLGRHSWNAVEIQGNWRLVDCAWARSSYEKEAKRFESDAAHKYVDLGKDPDRPGPTGPPPGGIVRRTAGYAADGNVKTLADRRRNWQQDSRKVSETLSADEPLPSGQKYFGVGQVFTDATRNRLATQQHPTLSKMTFAGADYYFVSDPAQLIFTHFPDDSQWQLLDRPLSLTEFEQLVTIGPEFFGLGLRLIGLQSSRIVVRTALTEVALRLRCPENRQIMFTFNLSLIDAEGRLVDSLGGVQLKRYGMHEIVDNIAHFRVRLPHPGAFSLGVFACDVTGNGEVQQMALQGVCSYYLIRECGDPESGILTTAERPFHVKETAVQAPVVKPYPACSTTSWGPRPGSNGRGLRPLLKGSVFHCNRHGVAELRFRFSDDLNREMVRFTADLKGSDSEEDEQQTIGSVSTSFSPVAVADGRLDGCVLSRIVGPDSDIVAFTVRVPRSGDFGLEIYTTVCDDHRTGVIPVGLHSAQPAGDITYRLYGQFLIVCDEFDPVGVGRSFPRLSPGFLGPQPMFHKLNLSVVSHVDPYIQLSLQHTAKVSSSAAARGTNHSVRDNTTSRELHIIIGAPPPSVNLTSRLTLVDEHRRTKVIYNEYVLQHRQWCWQKSRTPSTGSGTGNNLTTTTTATTTDENLVRVDFFLRLPEPGVYHLEFFAVLDSPSRTSTSSLTGNDDDDDDDDDDEVGSTAAASRSGVGDTLSPVYNYVVDFRVVDAITTSGHRTVTGKSSGAVALSPESKPNAPDARIELGRSLPPFPRQTNLWRSDGCILHTPLDGRLPLPLRSDSQDTGKSVNGSTSDAGSRKRTIVFRLEVPRVDRVAVVVGDKRWHYLERQPTASGDVRLQLWQGEVELPVRTTPIDMDEDGGRVGECGPLERYGRSVNSESNHRRRSSTIGVEVCAHYSELGTASYRTLLEYTTEI